MLLECVDAKCLYVTRHIHRQDAAPAEADAAPVEPQSTTEEPVQSEMPQAPPLERVGVRARLVMLPKIATKAAWGAVAPVRAPPTVPEAPPSMSPLAAGAHGLAAQEGMTAPASPPAQPRSRRTTSPARAPAKSAQGASGGHVRSRSQDNVLVIGSSGEPVAMMVRSASKDGVLQRRHSSGKK